MPFDEKISWATLGTIVVVYGVYFTMVLGAVRDTPLDDIAYQGLMILAVIGSVVMVAALGAYAAFSNASESDLSDERDKAITRRGGYVGGITLGALVLVPLGLAMLDVDQFWIAQTILGALVVSQLVEESTKLYFYRRGG
ncbi:MAG: hypothetical protein KDB69_00915 [Acidimicrobiia bacterium]|nr:hypothetical protein [Acidimicrobiia bacterium]